MKGISTNIEWFRPAVNCPIGLHYRVKIQSIKDRVSVNMLFISFCAAYANGEIKVKPLPPDMKMRQPRLQNTGYLDDYRVELFDASGKLLNPLPLTDADL